MTRRPRPTLLPRRRRGTVLIVAIGVLAIITALVLTLARSMRVEAVTSANYTASVRAEAVEQAAEQYAAELLVNQADQILTLDYTNFTGIPVGDAGYFWIIRPNFDDPMLPSYGFIDENAKLNINTATEDELMMLPGMTTDLADAIIDWRDADEDPSESGAGAESQYYMTLPNPYQAKNAPFESVEELLLVKGFTRDLLYGQSMADNNHFIPYDQTGDAPVGGLPSDFDPSTYRGLFDYLTVYSVASDPSVTEGGGGSGGTGGGAQQPGANGSTGSRSQVAGGGSGSGGNSGGAAGGTGGTGKPGAGSAGSNTGRININTAPREVLRCLPGLTESDVDAIISQRASSVSSDPTDTTWLQTTLGGSSASQIGAYITGQSFQYSADIVAVSANGRSFKRTRVIFDTRSTNPKIIYRRDLTEFGWPLDPQILDSLRHGTGIPGGGNTSLSTPGTSRRSM